MSTCYVVKIFLATENPRVNKIVEVLAFMELRKYAYNRKDANMQDHFRASVPRGVEETGRWVGGEGGEGVDLDRIVREGLLEEVTSEPRPE